MKKRVLGILLATSTFRSSHADGMQPDREHGR